MAAELAETPDAVARCLQREQHAVRRLGVRLRAELPPVVVTCARGSSDHAAGYFAYLLHILAGLPVASIGPSIASLYSAPLRLRGCLMVSVSQSGASPDIIALQAAARAAGALAVAIVNDAACPLAAQADITLRLHAGAEHSVAATKSCITAAALLAALVAEIAGDAALAAALHTLPGALRSALDADWRAALPAFAAANSAYVIARGPALPVAMEAALKLKETSVLHAEACSGAEVMHGPLQLLRDGFPVLAFRPADAAFASMGAAVARLTALGGAVFTCEPGGTGPARLPFTPSQHALLDPLVMLLAFYGFAEALARRRGHDPDRPSHLHKVTATL